MIIQKLSQQPRFHMSFNNIDGLIQDQQLNQNINYSDRNRNYGLAADQQFTLNRSQSQNTSQTKIVGSDLRSSQKTDIHHAIQSDCIINIIQNNQNQMKNLRRSLVLQGHNNTNYNAEKHNRKQSMKKKKKKKQKMVLDNLEQEHRLAKSKMAIMSGGLSSTRQGEKFPTPTRKSVGINARQPLSILDQEMVYIKFLERPHNLQNVQIQDHQDKKQHQSPDTNSFTPLQLRSEVPSTTVSPYPYLPRSLSSLQTPVETKRHRLATSTSFLRPTPGKVISFKNSSKQYNDSQVSTPLQNYRDEYRHQTPNASTQRFIKTKIDPFDKQRGSTAVQNLFRYRPQKSEIQSQNIKYYNKKPIKNCKSVYSLTGSIWNENSKRSTINWDKIKVNKSGFMPKVINKKLIQSAQEIDAAETVKSQTNMKFTRLVDHSIEELSSPVITKKGMKSRSKFFNFWKRESPKQKRITSAERSRRNSMLADLEQTEYWKEKDDHELDIENLEMKRSFIINQIGLKREAYSFRDLCHLNDIIDQKNKQGDQTKKDADDIQKSPCDHRKKKPNTAPIITKRESQTKRNNRLMSTSQFNNYVYHQRLLSKKSLRRIKTRNNSKEQKSGEKQDKVNKILHF